VIETLFSSFRFDPARAAALQEELARRVVRRDRIGKVRWIGGVDVDIVGGRGRAAVVVLEAGTLELLEARTAEREVRVPYIPGFLAFREVPVILAAFKKLRRRPDLLIVDGMGLIHPRRLGLACHLGLALGIPSIGCGKTPFVGEWDAPAPDRGAWSPVIDAGERVGAVLRTRAGVKPVFVSIGHRVSLRTATTWVLRTATEARLPQPIRLAHQAASLAHPAARMNRGARDTTESR